MQHLRNIDFRKTQGPAQIRMHRLGRVLSEQKSIGALNLIEDDILLKNIPVVKNPPQPGPRISAARNKCDICGSITRKLARHKRKMHGK